MANNNRLVLMNDLTAFQRDLLVVIAGIGEEHPHGLAIKEALDKYYDSPIQHGHLYPNLDALADRGFIEKGKLDKRSNYYALTDGGWEELTNRYQWVGQQIEQHVNEAPMN